MINTSRICMSNPKFRYTFRIFSSSTHLCRNKNEIYNSEDRPIPVLDEKFRLKLKDGYKHPRSIPAIAPSEEFTKNVLKIFETVYSSHKDHLKSYALAGNKMKSFIKHRKVPLEESEKKSRQQKIESRIKEEFSIDIVDKTENPDPNVLKKLISLEKNSSCKWAPIEFDETGSITYLVTRSAAEFASLVSIFNIIRDQDDSFQPRTLFDFGSGRTMYFEHKTNNFIHNF